MLGSIARHFSAIQGSLFPFLKEELGPLTDQQYSVIRVLDLLEIEKFVEGYGGSTPVGRPPSDRRAITRAFVSKAVLNLSTTRQLLDRLSVDAALRRVCGWERRSEVPSEAVFSRAFAELSEMQVPALIHEALIQKAYDGELVGHISRDSTQIEAREKPVVKPEKPKKVEKKRGRPKKGELREPKEPTRLEKQKEMTLEEMREDLPKGCDVGCKRNSKGFQESWTGYKLHLDVADGGVPISAILTSASVHDSQAAIALSLITEKRVPYLYELMDAAYDAPEIRSHSIEHGHVPIIDINTRRNTALKQEIAQESQRFSFINFELPETRRFKERSTVERANSALKDSYTARSVRVRGHLKVFAHLMFGVLALTVEQLMRLTQ